MTKGTMHIIKKDEIKGEAPELLLEELRCKLNWFRKHTIKSNDLLAKE